MPKPIEDIILSDAEKEALVSFVSKPLMVQAVEKMLLASIYHNGTLRAGVAPDPLRNGALILAFGGKAENGKEYTDQELGADLRAYASGVRLIEQGLTKIKETFKEPVKATETPKKTGR